MWPFSKSSPRRLEPVPEPDDTLEDEVEDLRRKVNGMRYDLDELTERFRRAEGRDAKRRTRGEASNEEGVANGRLPSLAVMRAQGRDPFHGR